LRRRERGAGGDKQLIGRTVRPRPLLPEHRHGNVRYDPRPLDRRNQELGGGQEEERRRKKKIKTKRKRIREGKKRRGMSKKGRARNAVGGDTLCGSDHVSPTISMSW
tara:strand:+ start:230 stop:550 length:321 start_codon:yes stop_codon:yes gene_type:complete